MVMLDLYTLVFQLLNTALIVALLWGGWRLYRLATRALETYLREHEDKPERGPTDAPPSDPSNNEEA